MSDESWHSNKMTTSKICVKVSNNNKNIYEDYCEYTNINNFDDVISSMRKVQTKVNKFLTELLEQNTSDDKKSYMVASPTDSYSSDEDVEVSSKKCKLTKDT